MSNPTTLQHEQQHHRACIGVLVRTPAGFTSAFAVNQHERASRLLRKAIAFFADRGELEGDHFTLAVVRCDEATPVPPGDRLDDHDVVEGDVFHLVSCRPHVDGS